MANCIVVDRTLISNLEDNCNDVLHTVTFYKYADCHCIALSLQNLFRKDRQCYKWKKRNTITNVNKLRKLLIKLTCAYLCQKSALARKKKARLLTAFQSFQADFLNL